MLVGRTRMKAGKRKGKKGKEKKGNGRGWLRSRRGWLELPKPRWLNWNWGVGCRGRRVRNRWLFLRMIMLLLSTLWVDDRDEGLMLVEGIPTQIVVRGEEEVDVGHIEEDKRECTHEEERTTLPLLLVVVGIHIITTTNTTTNNIHNKPHSTFPHHRISSPSSLCKFLCLRLLRLERRISRRRLLILIRGMGLKLQRRRIRGCFQLLPILLMVFMLKYNRYREWCPRRCRCRCRSCRSRLIRRGITSLDSWSII